MLAVRTFKMATIEEPSLKVIFFAMSMFKNQSKFQNTTHLVNMTIDKHMLLIQ
jgi:hypothetical protein